MPRLDDKVAIVTGGGGGIGGAICKLFAAEGAKVAAVDVDRDGTEGVIEEIEGAGGEAIACINDVSQAQEVEAVVAAAKAAFGAVHILVNCAAVITPTVDVVGLSEEDWDRALAVNLKSIFLMSKHAVPAIAEAGGGTIVNIASQLGHVGMAGRAAYVATKSATIGLTRVLALDHADQNIRVNSLSPGQIETQRAIAHYGSMERMRELRTPLHPIGRVGTVEEVAEAALFLATDASSFMTGADLLFDGGYTAI